MIAIRDCVRELIEYQTEDYSDDRDIIDYCIYSNRLYESRDYHNAVFIGYDQRGIPRYAMLRGTHGSWYMGEVNGSDKHYSFFIPANNKCQKLHLFESSIDLLSYTTLELLSGKDWRRENLLSIAGIYKPSQKIEESTLPSDLQQRLKLF